MQFEIGGVTIRPGIGADISVHEPFIPIAPSEPPFPVFSPWILVAGLGVIGAGVAGVLSYLYLKKKEK